MIDFRGKDSVHIGNFVFRTRAAAEAFVFDLGPADEGEAYVIETNGLTFIVAHFIEGERKGAI